MWEAIKDFLNELVENIPALFIVSGIIIFLLGAAGGISYWFVVQDNVGRTVMVGGGILFVFIGIATRGIALKALSVAKYGLKITSPVAGDNLGRVIPIRGTFKRLPPKGYDIRLLRLYPKSDAYYPMGHASPNLSDKTWEAAECDLGGDGGDIRIIGLYIVGPSGIVLLDYFKLAESEHRKTRNELEKLGGVETGFLPLFSKSMKTTDMHECHRVRVVRR